MRMKHSAELWRSGPTGPPELTVHDHDPLAARSLLVLRALTHADTGGIVAAPTTSLPEEFGGSRNWDYRYTWLRDAALTIEVTVAHGLTEGATLWRNWLLRAVAGDADNIQIMYGLAGERDLRESELTHLAGYERVPASTRIGNEAAGAVPGRRRVVRLCWLWPRYGTPG